VLQRACDEYKQSARAYGNVSDNAYSVELAVPSASNRTSTLYFIQASD
jgi:hypothetical protein